MFVYTWSLWSWSLITATLLFSARNSLFCIVGAITKLNHALCPVGSLSIGTKHLQMKGLPSRWKPLTSLLENRLQTWWENSFSWKTCQTRRAVLLQMRSSLGCLGAHCIFDFWRTHPLLQVLLNLLSETSDGGNMWKKDDNVWKCLNSFFLSCRFLGFRF